MWSGCRHAVMMRAALSVLALNAMKPHMETVLVQVTGVVALRARLAKARQRWSFEAWHHFSCCMRWRRNRLNTCCWLSWHAQAVAGRLRLRKSRQYYRRVLLQRGMKAWTAFYTQVRPLLAKYVARSNCRNNSMPGHDGGSLSPEDVL